MPRELLSDWWRSAPQTSRSRALPRLVRTPSHAIGHALVPGPESETDLGILNYRVRGSRRRCVSDHAHLQQFRSHYLPPSRSADFGDWLVDWDEMMQPNEYWVHLTNALSGNDLEVKGKKVPLLLCSPDITVDQLHDQVVRTTHVHYKENVSLQYDMLVGGKVYVQPITVERLWPGYMRAALEPPFPAIAQTPLSCFFFNDHKPNLKVLLHDFVH